MRIEYNDEKTLGYILEKHSNIKFVFTQRDGGVSQKEFDSLNLAFHVADDESLVQINHDILANSLDYDKYSLVYMKQIHSDIVHIVTEDDNFNAPPTCDALITDRTNTPLMVMVADCSPVLFYDPVQKVVAAAHSGRTGTFKNIVKNVIEKMNFKFHSNPKNILVNIGAGIGGCCYEVGEEIVLEAKELGYDYAITKKDEKYFLNINDILQQQLKQCGIKEKNLTMTTECTACNTDKYFSYRAEGKTGRFAGVICLI